MRYKKTKKNVTKYGEEICTEFSWLPLEKQKENAIRFENMTKKDDKSSQK